MEKVSNKQGLLALSPMLVLVLLMVGISTWIGDFYKVPLVVLFIVTSVVALATLRKLSINERITVFSKGAGHSDIMLMIWIFILAGAFAASAKAIGAVDAMVNLTLCLLPSSMLLPGIFAAACLVSLSVGTSVGTIAALVPIVTGLSQTTGLDLSLLTAATVGGAFFGDNLSFISDTTVVATKTQGCKMSDKFKTNIIIVLPAAIITFIIYLFIGQSTGSPEITTGDVNWVLVLPYLTVLITAIAGVNVMIVLLIGIVFTGVVGLSTGCYDIIDCFGAMTEGIMNMSETIFIALLAGGLMAVIRHGGGISWIIQHLTPRSKSKKKGELSIAALVSAVNFCTANNTVAILSVGMIAKDISQRFGISPRKTASILDTCSCFVQAIIPYGAQLLIASGLASISATDIMTWLYYPYLVGVATLIVILTGFPKVRS